MTTSTDTTTRRIDRFPGAHRAEDLMGSHVGIDIRTALPQRELRPLLDDAFQWLRWVEETFSTQRADSELNRLARGEITPEEAAPELTEVLQRCAELGKATDGFFGDATAGGRSTCVTGPWSGSRARWPPRARWTTASAPTATSGSGVRPGRGAVAGRAQGPARGARCHASCSPTTWPWPPPSGREAPAARVTWPPSPSSGPTWPRRARTPRRSTPWARSGPAGSPGRSPCRRTCRRRPTT